jgi:hypothetical protein
MGERQECQTKEYFEEHWSKCVHAHRVAQPKATQVHGQVVLAQGISSD